MVAKKYENREESEQARRERNRIRKKRLRAERALAEGRVPGRVGAPVVHLKPGRDAENARAKVARYRERNRDELRKKDRESKREIRRLRALVEGRKPGHVGRVRTLSDAERRDRATDVMRRWRERNPERARELSNRQYASNKVRVRKRVRERRLKLKIAGEHTAQDILDLWEAQKRSCVFCLKGLRWGKFEVDHHVPLSRGGSNDRSNLRLLHPHCNRSKGARDPTDHALRNGLLCW